MPIGGQLQQGGSAARLALAQEGAVEVALVGLLDLGMGDQVVEEVGPAAVERELLEPPSVPGW